MFTKRANEVRTYTVSFTGKLLADELLSGTPTVAEVSTTALTISSPTLTASPTSPIGKFFIPTSHGVQFTVEGGVSGTSYTIRLTAGTDQGQTLIQEVTLRVN